MYFFSVLIPAEWESDINTSFNFFYFFFPTIFFSLNHHRNIFNFLVLLLVTHVNNLINKGLTGLDSYTFSLMLTK